MIKKIIITFIALFTSTLAFASKPNVVIIYADDMGYGDVSYGNSQAKIQTPAIDALAKSGMTFTDGHSSSSICSPSRFAMLTGQHHWRRFHDIVRSYGKSVFLADDFTLPKMFKSKGYKTAMIGKWHLGWDWAAMGDKKTKTYDWSRRFPMGPVDQGFDYYYGDGTINFPPFCWIENDKVVTPPEPATKGRDQAPDWSQIEVLPRLTEKAVEYISKQSKDEPFFLYFALNSPHEPVVPSPEFQGKSNLDSYGDFVMQTDASVARVIAELERKGLRDNTLIIFTADNGAEKTLYKRQSRYGHWSSGPFRGAKRDLFEGGHHVPFIVSWKGKIQADSKSDELISQVDLAATFAKIISYDLKKNEAQDSYDILDVWTNKKKGKDSVRYALVHNTYADQYALRKGDWVYIDTSVDNATSTSKNTSKKVYIPSDKTPTDEDTPALLYNLKNDIAQVNNLYNQHPEIVKELKAILDEYVKGKPCAPHAQ